MPAVGADGVVAVQLSCGQVLAPLIQEGLGSWEENPEVQTCRSVLLFVVL